MKQILLPLACVAAMWLAGSRDSLATPVVNSNSGRDYLLGIEDLSRWTFGIYTEAMERDVKVDGFSQSMKSTRFMALLGYDVIDWITAYFVGGQNRTKFSVGNYGDQEFEYGVGLNLNLVDQEILDPTLFEDRLRLNAGVQYSSSQTEDPINTIEWDEFSASLTLSIVNDCEGDKFFSPNSIVLFAGPVYSDLRSDEISVKENIGFTVGLGMFLTEKISLSFAVTQYDDPSMSAGLTVRF